MEVHEWKEIGRDNSIGDLFLVCPCGRTEIYSTVLWDKGISPPACDAEQPCEYNGKWVCELPLGHEGMHCGWNQDLDCEETWK